MDRAKIEEILAQTDFVRSLARSLLVDESRADDISQQALLAAFESRPTTERPLRAWFSGVVRNLTKLSFRREKSRRKREQLAARPERDSSAAEEAELKEVRRIIVATVLELEEPYRTAIQLRYFGELNAQGVAEELNVPVKTVRTRLKRGLAKLRQKLDKEFGDRGAWCLALAPLAGLKVGAKAATAGVAASTVSTVSGGILMATKVKVGIAVVLIVGTGLLVLQLFSTGDRAVPTQEAVSTESVHESMLGTERNSESLEGEADKLVRVPVEPSNAASQTSTEEKEETVLVDGRFLDPEGVPVGGVLVTCHDAEFEIHNVIGPDGMTMKLPLKRASDAGRGDLENTKTNPVVAVSGSDGRFNVSAPKLERAGGEVWLSVEKSGYTKTTLSSKATHNMAIHFGDILLHPGGSISGIVVDDQGVPVPNACVFWTEPEIAGHTDRLIRISGAAPPKATSRWLVQKSTGSDGRFLLDGIQEGEGRVWAKADHTNYSHSEVIEVKSQTAIPEIRLVLEAVPKESLVQGVVLAQDGSPVPGASIAVLRPEDVGYAVDRCRADQDGKFRHVLVKKVPHIFEAEDKEGKYEPARVEKVTGGTQDLILQFTDLKQCLRLSVLSSDGKTVESFRVGVHPQGDASASYSDYHTFRREDLNKDGLAVFPVRGTEFLLSVDDPSYQHCTLGPYYRASLPDQVEAILTPLPAIEGRVTSHGNPVAGAKVGLCRIIEPGVIQKVNDFACLSSGWSKAKSLSNEEGRFSVPIQKAGSFYLRAEADGFSASESGPFELDGEKGMAGVEIELSEGGSIEGYVTPITEESQAGKIVAISRGDGFTWSTRTDEDGSYRFEHLTPGPWQVARREKEINLGGAISFLRMRSETVPKIQWSCVVEEGKTTRFDLDLTKPDSPCISGFLSIGGVTTDGWQASLFWESFNPAWLDPSQWKYGAKSKSTVGNDGAFILKIPHPEKYWMQIVGDVGEGQQFIVRDLVHATDGEIDWSYSIPVGELKIEGLPQLRSGAEFYHRWDGTGDVTVYVEVFPDEDGVAVVPAVPSGAGRIVRITREPRKKPYEEVLAEVNVPDGGSAVVQLK